MIGNLSTALAKLGCSDDVATATAALRLQCLNIFNEWHSRALNNNEQ